MTRKDYVLIAAALAAARSDTPDDVNARGAVFTARRIVARNIADALAQDNPRFDRARFLAAAGVAS